MTHDEQTVERVRPHALILDDGSALAVMETRENGEYIRYSDHIRAMADNPMSDALEAKSLISIINGIVRDDVHNDTFSEDVTGANIKELSDLILAAMPDIVRGMVLPLVWDKQRNKMHWICNDNLSGKSSFIKMYAGTDVYNLYADGFRGTGCDFPTLEAAQQAANDQHAAQVLKALGL